MRMIQVAKSGEASLKVGKKSKNLKNPQQGKLSVKGGVEIPQGKVIASFKKSLALNLKRSEGVEVSKKSSKDGKTKALLFGSRDIKNRKIQNLPSKSSKISKKNLKEGKDMESTLAQLVPQQEAKISEDPKVESKDLAVESSKGDVKDLKTSLMSQINGEKITKEPKKGDKNPRTEWVNETKSQGKKDKRRLSVNDLRTDNQREVPESVNPENPKVSADPTIQNSEFEASTEKTIVLGTSEVSAEGEGGKAQAPVMKEAATQLKQQLKDFGNSEIVKNTRFILKDNNVGEIKLILKPESLGEVKINLNLNDNNLAGQIVVENAAVKEVFQENMSSLTKALESKGFDTANLDLSLSDKGEGRGNREQGENKQYFSDRLKKFEESGRVVRYGLPTAGINLTA